MIWSAIVAQVLTQCCLKIKIMDKHHSNIVIVSSPANKYYIHHA